jgi:hypothetical protein
MCIESRQLWAILTLIRNHIFIESATNIGHENFRQRLDCGTWQGVQDLSWQGVQDLSWTSKTGLASKPRQLRANWTLVLYHIFTLKCKKSRPQKCR